MGKKIDNVVKRLDNVQRLIFKAGVDALDHDVDPVMVSSILDGLLSGIECAKTLLTSEDFDEFSDETIADAIFRGALLATTIKLMAIDESDDDDDADDIVNRVNTIAEQLVGRS